MAQNELETKLGDYVEDAHAMESNVLQMLDSMISTTDDKQIREVLERHRKQTERHQERLRDRLEDLGRGTSLRKESQTLAGALLKGVTDRVRGDKAGKNARDGFITEHMEIAAYELLERLAERAGDAKTAQVARQNRRDEESMAKKIAGNWDKFLDLTLAEEGIEAPKKRSTAKRSTAKRSTAKPSTAKRSASTGGNANRGSARRTTAKRATTKRSGSRSRPRS
jgi:ferritin-like metal-binding protein YciE